MLRVRARTCSYALSDSRRRPSRMSLLHIYQLEGIRVSVKNTLLLHRPWPCIAAAETAIQPLTWHSEILYSRMLSFYRGVFFFTDTGMVNGLAALVKGT